MTKTGYMKSFFGPFFRGSTEDKWHWRIECSNFPVNEAPQTKISTIAPNKEVLCSVCQGIEDSFSTEKKVKSNGNLMFIDSVLQRN